MSELRYHLRKCLPLVGIYMFGLFVMLWALQTNLCADTYGKTQFKTCRWCDELTYQFNPKCNNCGSKDFRDIYLKPDIEKQNKKKEKAIKPIGIEVTEPHGFKVSTQDEVYMNQIYEMYITPIEVLIYRLGYEQDKDVAELIGDLMVSREQLIELYKLEKYRRMDYHYPRYGD